MKRNRLSLLLSRTQKREETQQNSEESSVQSPAQSGLKLPSGTLVVEKDKSYFVDKSKNTGQKQSVSLVDTYKKEICYWCDMIYGDGDVLNKDLDNILHNPTSPTIKADLVRRIKAYPASVHPLAGKQVLGFKNKARKEAEGHVENLCVAISHYAISVKYAYEDEVRSREAATRKVEIERGVQKSPGAAKGSVVLSNEEREKILNHPYVAEYSARALYWSKEIFGSRRPVRRAMKDVLADPSKGEEIVQILQSNPEKFHRLAGYGLLGVRSSVRSRAESRTHYVVEAISGFTDAVKLAREAMLQERGLQQQHATASKSQRQEVVQQRQKTRDKQTSQQCGVQKSPDVAEGAVVLSHEQIAYHPYIIEHSARVQYWSKNVFGSKDILQNAMKDIVADHTKGEKIARDLIENPRQFYSLVGYSMFGRKSRSRVNAESNLVRIAEAVRNYANAVKLVTNSIIQERSSQQQAQQQHAAASQSQKQKDAQKRQETREEQATGQRGVQKSPSSQEQRMTFSDDECSQIANDVAVSNSRRRVRIWSKGIYNNADALQKEMGNICIDPTAGMRVLQNLQNNPECYGKFAGYNICGIKSSRRVRSENRLEALSDAVTSYTNAIIRARDSVIQRRGVSQQHATTSRSQQQEVAQKHQESRKQQVTRQRDEQQHATTSRSQQQEVAQKHQESRKQQVTRQRDEQQQKGKVRRSYVFSM